MLFGSSTASASAPSRCARLSRLGPNRHVASVDEHYALVDSDRRAFGGDVTTGQREQFTAAQPAPSGQQHGQSQFVGFCRPERQARRPPAARRCALCAHGSSPLIRAGERPSSPSSTAGRARLSRLRMPAHCGSGARCRDRRPARTSSGVISVSTEFPSVGRMLCSRWYS